MTVRHLATRRWARNSARAGALVSALMLVFSTWSVLSASAAATNAGNAQVIDPTTNQPLASGGSSTDFTLKLPSGAACTGDSATGQYKVQSYMVPSSVDPGTLQYGSAGPQPTATGSNFKEPLYDTTGTAYVNQQTANATNSGGPGPIINIPTFNFEVFTNPPQIPAGTYNVGISCTLGPASTTQVDKFWIVQFVVTTDPADSPAQIHWTAQAAPPPATTTTTSVATTTTSGGGGQSTTTTIGSGSTATTIAGDQSSTTVAPAVGASNSSAGGGTSSGAVGSPSDPSASNAGSSGGSLPNTGGRVLSLFVWAGLLAIFGRIAVLLGRPMQVRRERVLKDR